MSRGKHKKGIGLIEVIVGASILSLAGVGLLMTYALYVNASLVAPRPIQAAFLEDEGMEVMRLIRDKNWGSISGLSLGTTYYLSFDAGAKKWSTAASGVLINGIFDRIVVVSAVNRSVSKDIVSSGGTLDPDTKKITVSVSWLYKGATTTKQLVGYLTKLF